jgi:hypothetical protein
VTGIGGPLRGIFVFELEYPWVDEELLGLGD